MMLIISKDIAELKPDDRNARKHDKRNLEAIRNSLERFGQQKPIVIDKNNIVIAGNGVYFAAKELGWKELNCVVCELDDLNKMAYAIADNRTSDLSEWDDMILQSILTELSNQKIDVPGYNESELDKILGDIDERNIYTDKISMPDYEPLGMPVDIDDLYDDSKARELIAEIDKSNISDELKNFLRLASYRHVKFDYEKIAEFYSQNKDNKLIKKLFEDNVLVIIDMEGAIRAGIVQIRDEVMELFKKEYEDES